MMYSLHLEKFLVVNYTSINLEKNKSKVKEEWMWNLTKHLFILFSDSPVNS